MAENTPWVIVLMGSASDASVVKGCTEVLESYGIPFTQRVLSAHRTPDETAAALHGAQESGVEVVVAAAGMAAHLAGACAAHTTLPVIGIPVASGALNGVDALYSTVMMPPGMPVATVAVNGAANAGHLAAQILQGAHPELRAKLREARRTMREKVLQADRDLPR